jgi:flagellar basal-body rod modification protein FlgD
MAMSALTALSATSTNTTPPTTSTTNTDAKAATLDYNNFLQLLVAQMENQDPTDPMDATEQMAQLASFSQVEQQIKTNTALENVISQNSLATAANYIGKTIESADGKTSGVVESIAINADGIVATLKSGEDVTIQEGITILSANTSSDGTNDSSGDDGETTTGGVDNGNDDSDGT